MNDEGYVQPIMLLIDKSSPAAHIDAVHTAALASVPAYAEETLSVVEPDPSWAAWLDGPFTKSVRRADAKTYEKISTKFTAAEHAAVTVGKAQAIAFRSTTYGPCPGTWPNCRSPAPTCPCGPWTTRSPPLKAPPCWCSTPGWERPPASRAPTQGTHALFAWFLSLDTAARRAWYESGCPFRMELVQQEAFDAYAAGIPEDLLIVDAGRTEIDPGTATAFVKA
jgi:hypothetical protein